MDQMIILPLIGAVLSTLLGMNVWFVKRLVGKIDAMEKGMNEKMPMQTAKIEQLENSFKELSHSMRDFGQMRERIAVVEALIKRSGRGPKA